MNNRPQSTASFSLVEVTLALGVAAFCLIAILGLLPAGVNTNQASVRQTTANGILSTIVADLRATSATSTKSGLLGISITSSTTLYCDGNGACSTSSSANTIFKATVTPSGTGGGDDGEEDEGGSGGTERFNVKITWPYSKASPAPAPAGVVETFVALDRVSGSMGGRGDDD